MHENIVEEIRALHQLGSKLDTTASIEGVLRAAAEAVARLLPCDRVSLIEIDRERRRVGFFARGGRGGGQVITTVGYEELEHGLSGWVLTHQESALSPKGQPDPREAPEVYRRRVETNCGSIIVVPLQAGGTTMGTMTAINGVLDPDFADQDVKLMEMFADYCAIVIQNARNFLHLKELNERVGTLNSTLQKRNALKDNLFTILAHDLRGPVGNTAVLIDLITEQVGTHGDLDEILKLGSRAAHQTYGLLENLLSWVRSQIEGVEVLHGRVVLAQVVDHVVGWLGPIAAKKGVRVYSDCPGHFEVLSDQATIETILRNMLSNAVKFSFSESQVLVRVTAPDPGHLALEVEDFGPGMPQEKVAELFGRIKVSSKAGTAGETGAGLGMMFCADLAASIGGQMEVQSELGSGSTFRLVLPRAPQGEL